MKNSTKMVLVALAAIVLLSTVAILTPRATHVLAAGPTTITYNMPRNPWTSYCAPPAAPPNIYYTSCTITAPSGGELVIQMISGYQIAPVPTRLQAQVSTQVAPAIGPTINWFTILSPVDIQGSDYYYLCPVPCAAPRMRDCARGTGPTEDGSRNSGGAEEPL
ncbi:MAG: hypothetical protein ACLQVM_18615 [Terriglobia bacterium]